MKELIAIQFLFPLNTKSQPFVLKSGNTAGYNPKSPNQHFQKYHTRPLDFGEIYKMTIFMKESIFLGFKQFVCVQSTMVQGSQHSTFPTTGSNNCGFQRSSVSVDAAKKSAIKTKTVYKQAVFLKIKISEKKNKRLFYQLVSLCRSY